MPDTLPALADAIGDHRGPGWEQELHPVSMAKLAGRRIYRKGAFSIAESLDAACAVRETEVIQQHDDGRLEFMSYAHDGQRVEYGYFPAGPDKDAIKPSPDACMGCHYTLDARRFEVRVPSYRALNLTLRQVNNVPMWRDDSACREDGETLVWHPTAPTTP